jgi:Flp pilus assembly protein TadD/predicted aspartyl protease
MPEERGLAMVSFRRISLTVALLAVLIVGPKATSSTDDAELQLQLASLLFEETRFAEALQAYRQALDSPDSSLVLRARIGYVRTALRIGLFLDAQREAASLQTMAPRNPEALSAYADAVWSAGQFDEAENAWTKALDIAPDSARARHGFARSLASRSRLDDALVEAQAALKDAPRDPEIHHTVGAIYERMGRFEQAAVAFSNYINLLPNKDRSEKAAWSRSQVRFLRSFGEKQPLLIEDTISDRLHTVDFRLIDDKVIVKARVNGGRLQDFVLDTGSEQTTISRQTASAASVRPITYTLSAGVGEVGLRGLQLGRIDELEIGTLKLQNVPTLIKAPPLRGVPKKETESFSPMAFGLSMIIDYGTRKLTIGRSLPEEQADIHMGMRHHRLTMVRGVINNNRPTYFVVDTGGEVISISTATAESLNVNLPRKIGLKVYGTSGWDRDAFLMPGVDLKFDHIAYPNFSVVVLNLRAPSVLLGFEVGGIVGHKFLSPYRVALDLPRSEMRMTKVGN